VRKCAEESIPACKGRISGGDDKQRGGTQNESRLVCTRNSACESNIPQLDTKYRCREISQSVTQFTMAEHGRKQIDQAYHSSPTWTYTKPGLLIALHQQSINLLSCRAPSWFIPHVKCLQYPSNRQGSSLCGDAAAFHWVGLMVDSLVGVGVAIGVEKLSA